MITKFSLDDVKEIAKATEKIFRREPILIEREDIKSAIVVGDLHGDLKSFNRIREILNKWGGAVIFLGDYVDRGENSLEVLLNSFYLKLENPDMVFLLRGNHELIDINSYYGFKLELESKFGDEGEKLFSFFNEIFAQMPIAMRIDNGQLILLHGGIPINVESIDDFRKIPKGIKESYENDILLQILWNDPFEGESYAPSPRGLGIYLFGREIFEKFMKNSHAKILIRAHQFFITGYKYFFNNRLLSIFSTINYVGRLVDAKIAKYNYGKIELISLLE